MAIPYNRRLPCAMENFSGAHEEVQMNSSVRPRSTVPASVVPIILAAGDSSRMGYPKALLPLSGQTFLTAILGELDQLGFPPPRVILGRDARRIEPLIAGWRHRLLVNQDPSRGQL